MFSLHSILHCIYITQALGFGLSQFGVGVRRDLPIEVVETISYWLNVLMTCAPGDADCPSGTDFSLFEHYQDYGRSDAELCRGPVEEPILPPAEGDAMEGDTMEETMDGDIMEDTTEAGTMEDTTSDGTGRLLTAVGGLFSAAIRHGVGMYI